MKSFARVVVGAIAGLALGAAVAPAPSRAADMPLAMPYAPVAPPLYSWTACYGGFNIGGGGAKKSFTDVNGFFSVPPGGDLGSHTAKGVVGGGQTGCDYQAGLFVFGVQGLFDASGMKGSNFLPNPLPVVGPPFLFAATSSSFVQWFATATARAGVLAAPTLLLYAKGGGAWAHDVLNVSIFNSALPSANGSATPSGWTAGLGLEWAFFGGNFTAFAEYDYLSFGTTRVNYTLVTTPGLTVPLDMKQSVNLFLFGINYRFGVGGRAY